MTNRGVETRLLGLGRTRAPRRLAAAVLAEIGVGDEYATLATPIGPFFVAHTGGKLTAVSRAIDEAEFRAWFRSRVGRPLRRVEALPERLVLALEATLAGQGRGRLEFDLGSLRPFERDVLLKALEIPRGEVRPYGWIAREIGRPAAVRAVGTALAHNPIALFIPCHRVVRTDGHIGEYGAGGPEAKTRMLAHEGLDAGELERLARAGVRLLGSRTTHVFCFPSCRHARRIGAANRVGFGGHLEAIRAGYRPCRDCRPAEAEVA